MNFFNYFIYPFIVLFRALKDTVIRIRFYIRQAIPKTRVNITNIDKAIAIMERAHKLDMRFYQRGNELSTSIDELHGCNNSACFAGYIAISEEFQKDGGKHGYSGEPIFNYQLGDRAISEWLNINHKLSYKLVNGDVEYNETLESIWSHFYNCPWVSVQPHDVIYKLQQIKKGLIY